MDDRMVPTHAVLDYGLENGTITSSEADFVVKQFKAFISTHPDYQFLSPKERRESHQPMSSEEERMWTAIQPIISKAQGVEDDSADAHTRLKLARESSPLYKSNFTEAELEKLKLLAPAEYELLK